MAETPMQEPVAYQRLVDGKWVECSYFVAYGWDETISPNCRALYAHPAVEAARASLPAPLPDEEWLKEAEALIARLDGYLTSPEQVRLGDALLAHLRARHGIGLETTDRSQP